MSDGWTEGLVSVVVPTYNRARLLPMSVASCMEQTYQQVEVIVVDDGSTDNTPQVLAELEEKYGNERLRWARQENAGACAARNRGMDMARGEFLQFLDSDDFLDPIKFERQVTALRESGADVAVCDYQRVLSSSPTVPFDRALNDGDLREKLAAFGTVMVFTPLIRRDRVPSELRWNLALTHNQDTDFMFRLFLGVRDWVYTPGFWCSWVHHEGDRVSDRQKKHGPQYYELLQSGYDYWRVAREKLNAGSGSMVSGLAAHLIGDRIRYSRDRKELRKFSGFGFRRPLSLRLLGLCVVMLIKALVPRVLLEIRSALHKRGN